MESWCVHPDVASCFHQLVCIVESTVGRQGNVALGGEHDFHFHASLGCILECLLQFVTQGEVGTDELDAVLCIVDGVDIEVTYDVLRNVWLAVDDAHHLVVSRGCGVGLESVYQIVLTFGTEVFCAIYMLSAHLVPHFQEDGLQRVHLVTVDTAVHVVPGTHNLCSLDVIVGHVHTACIGYLSVDDNNLAVVAVEDGVNPGKLHWFVFINLYAVGTNLLDVSFA